LCLITSRRACSLLLDDFGARTHSLLSLATFACAWLGVQQAFSHIPLLVPYFSGWRLCTPTRLLHLYMLVVYHRGRSIGWLISQLNDSMYCYGWDDICAVISSAGLATTGKARAPSGWRHKSWAHLRSRFDMGFSGDLVFSTCGVCWFDWKIWWYSMRV
jgi:hypothetical protein